MKFNRVKIVTFAPINDSDAIRDALGEAGAGIIGQYSYCSFSSVGKGRYIPSDAAKPHLGQANKLEEVDEDRIEVVCDRTSARFVIDAMKVAHPYEEVAFDIYPLIDEAEL